GAAGRLVAGESTGTNVDRGGAGRGIGEQQAAAVTVAADPTDVAGATRGHVAGDGTLAQEERGPTAIEHGAAMAVRILRHKHTPETADGLVLSQRPAADPEAAPSINPLAREAPALLHAPSAPQPP